ncbi:hypothetical protein TcG_05821 [Trypanosoma cruzi]|uniref:WWE domain-containing protein n=2 Tax=Trypanosoma cruzi TaxID=5693 RepID=V5BEB9_TRYCR|nr:hypothetical protein TCDM_07534 [Trypanosoma cruzi Dm28c]KAF8279049.1 putative WD domain, G-beta repeat [Trypanosoma cruzi]PBJ77417.1 hypothetical protein BCY84_06470 [Trypanosoma cruzi cruzi]PWU99854.1 hypothetical protein C4B63_8g207 [Trypanosoma cruzi]RNF17270.1 hypothetical protein TcG_05821 [Trypanosoma cruzi]
MGSGGSTSLGGRITTVKEKKKSEPRKLKVTDYTNRPLPARFGRAVFASRMLAELPPPPTAEDDGQYAWFVENLDRPGEWEAYTLDVSERLDAAWRSGQRECLILSKKKRICTVDLNAMVQMAAGSTTRSRRVKRVEVEKCGDSTVREKRHFSPDPFLEEALDDAGRGEDMMANENGENGCHAEEGVVGEADNTDASRLPCLLRSVAAHSTTPYTLAFSSDGRTLLTGTRGELLHWDLETAIVLTAFDVKSSTVLSAAYSSDGSRVVCGGSSKIAWLFDTNSPDAQMTFAGHTSKIYGVDFLAGEERLATISMDKTLRCWDVRTSICVQSDECHTAPIFTLATSKRCDWLALSGGDDHVICSHDFRVGSNAVTARFCGHRKTIWTCAFRGDENQFASSGMDKALNIWDLRQPSEPILKVFYHMHPVHFVEYMPHDRGILTCARDWTVRLTDAVSGEPVWRVKAHVGHVFRARYHFGTRMMATGGGDGHVNIWRYDNADKW